MILTLGFIPAVTITESGATQLAITLKGEVRGSGSRRPPHMTGRGGGGHIHTGTRAAPQGSHHWDGTASHGAAQDCILLALPVRTVADFSSYFNGLGKRWQSGRGGVCYKAITVTFGNGGEKAV